MSVAGGRRGALALKRWLDQSHLSVVPVSHDDTFFAKEIRYYVLSLQEINGLQIPAPILKARDSMNDRLGVKFSFSLYNAKSQTFFGRTHGSPTYWFDSNKHSTYDVTLDHFIYFASPIYDDDCYGVAEIELIHEHNKSGVKYSYALGWTTLKIFKGRNIIDIDEEDDGDDDFYNTISLFDGSPRALYSMSASDVSSKVSQGSKWQKRPGKIVYAFNKNASVGECCASFQATRFNWFE